MNIELMKHFDELFGPVICLILHIYNAIRKIFIKPNLLPVNKILLIKFFGMGSIVMMGPMIRALRNKFPNAKIAMLTFASNQEICELTGLFDDIVTIRTDSVLQTMWNLIKKIFVLRRKQFDIAIDLEFFSKTSTVICYLTGSRNRIGFFLMQIGVLVKMMWRGNLLTHQVFYNPHKPTAVAFLALATAIGAQTDDLSYAAINVSPDIQKEAEALLSKYVNHDEKIVVMNINASPLCLERRWPIERFVQLAEKILNKENVKIVLTGDKADVSYVDKFVEIMKANEKLINLAGKLNIGGLAVLLRKARVFVTNDSGPLHIAVSLGIPTVSLFGPETPVRYGPHGSSHAVFYSGVYCSPCLNVFNQKTAPCNGENVCMRKILLEDVYKAVEERY